MIDFVDDASAMLETLGGPVTIDGQPTMAIITTKEVADDGMGGLIVIVIDLSALISTADVASLLIECGENGSELVAGDTVYKVLSMRNNGDGFTTLRLAES